MKVTLYELAKTIEKLKDKPEECKAMLKYYFSFPENIDIFSKFCFPQYIKGSIPFFHIDFYNYLLDPKDYAFAAPRGHSKSTTVGLVFISWCLINQKEKYIVYISQNHSKTVQFIEPLRMEFSQNANLRWLYGDLTPKGTKDEYGRDREDCIDINGCRVEAVSFEKNLRGFKYGNMRPTLIIGDDIESDERVINPLLRQKDEDKLNKVILPSKDVTGRFKMIGTILHLDSLLMKKIKLYNGVIYTAENDSGAILWSERFTREILNEFKRSMGSVAYQQEFLNNPVDNETSTIKREWIMKCLDSQFSYSYEDMDELYLGVDFAFSDRMSADSSAFVDIGIKRDRYGNQKKYILNIEWKKGLSALEQFDYIKQLHYSHNYNIIALEENSIKSVSSEIKTLSLPIKMFWTGSKDSLKSTYNNSRTFSKENAVERLAVEFENGLWCIPYRNEKEQKMANRLISELTSWAKQDGKLIETGVHPDSPIGIILVNESLNKPKYGLTI